MEMKNFEEMNKKSDMLLVQRLSKIQCKCLNVNVFINLLFKYTNFHFTRFTIQGSNGDWYITNSLKDRTTGFEQSKKLKMQIRKCYKLP